MGGNATLTARGGQMSKDFAQLAVNTLKGLAIDGVQRANSGHPGMPMGMADLAVVVWTKFLKTDPSKPTWADRDRFVLSNGHGSMLLYSLLHLSGFPVTTQDLRQFRQWGSVTAGHPERHPDYGIEGTFRAARRSAEHTSELQSPD